jgi:hypothetical protein
MPSLSSVHLSAPLSPGLRALSGLVGRLRRWPVESQLSSRRNAMVACTVLAARRAEHDEVEEFLHDLLAVRRATAAAHA